MSKDDFIALGLTLMLRMVKDKTERSKWKRSMLKLFKAIADAYQDDPEFQNL